MLTTDPFFSAEEFKKSNSEFKKSALNKVNESKVFEALSDDEINDLISRIKVIDLSEYRINDLDLYRQIIKDTLSLCEEDIISPHISRNFDLEAVNDAVNFIKEKKCTGKILIDLKNTGDKSQSTEDIVSK